MKKAFWLLFALGLAARLVLALVTPLEDRPGGIPYFNDEKAHLNYVRYLAVWNELPVQTSSILDGIEKAEFEYYQAPLYYLLVRPFYALGSRWTPGRELYWVRAVSIVFSALSLIVLYLAARRFFPDYRTALGVLLLASLGGIPLRFGSLVTNDSLFFTISCLYFALILEIRANGCDVRLFIAGIVVAVAGLWTKASFVLMLPLLPAVLLFGPARSWVKCIIGLAVPLAAIFPWYLRNDSLYGRFIPLHVASGPPVPITLENAVERITITANYFVRSLVFPYDGLWGGLLDKVLYPLEGIAFLGLVILGLWFLRRFNPAFFLVFLGGTAFNVIGYFYLNYLFPQAEARHIIPALPFILVLLALGAETLAGERKNRAFLWIGGWVALPWLTVLL